MTVQEIKSTRVSIDGLFKAIAELPKSREVALAYTKCQESKMWLGKALQALEVATPYKESKDVSTGEYIAPTADEGKTMQIVGSTVVETIKSMRYIVDEFVGVINDSIKLATPEQNVCRHELVKAYEYIIECGMWLGMELGRIRDEQNN